MHGQVYFYEMAILVLSLLCMDKFISIKWQFWHYHCYAWISLFLLNGYFGIIIVMHGQVYFYEMAILVLSLLCMDKFISIKWQFWHYHCYAWTSLFL